MKFALPSLSSLVQRSTTESHHVTMDVPAHNEMMGHDENLGRNDEGLLLHDEKDDDVSCATGTGTVVNRTIDWELDEKENQASSSTSTSSSAHVFIPCPPTETQRHANRNRGSSHPPLSSEPTAARLPSPLGLQSLLANQSLEMESVAMTKSPTASVASSYTLPSSSLLDSKTASAVGVLNHDDVVLSKENSESLNVSPASKQSDSIAQVTNATDPYEWAYNAWRRKHLLPPIPGQVVPSGTNTVRAAPHSTPSTRSTNDSEFASVMRQWKTSDGSATTHQARVIAPPATKWQPKPPKHVATSSTSGPPTVNHSRRQTWIPPPRQSLSVAPPVDASSRSSPPLITESSSPVHEVPKSQAWKLKMNQKSTLERRKRATLAVVPSTNWTVATTALTKKPSSAPRSFVSPMSRKDYKSVVQDVLRDVGAPLTTEPLLATLDEPVVEVAPLPVPSPSERLAALSETRQSLQRERSLSQLKNSRPMSDSVAAIRSQLQREREAMSESLRDWSMTVKEVADSIKNQESLPPIESHESTEGSTGECTTRVMDLSIENYDDASLPILCSSIPREVQVVDNADPLNVFSPFAQRVMRNLEKVYHEDSPIPTPKGMASTSDRPWQRDRFLHRVDNRNGETNTEDLPPICLCSKSVFSGNDDMIDFYLPLMGTACSCGETSTRPILATEEPTSLIHILRPWQVAFLGCFGIYRGEELVKANHRSGAALANALQRYRKKEGMTPYRTKCCTMALQIWSKTSKAFVRSIRNQIKAARNNVPEMTQSSELDDENQSTMPSTTALRLPNTLYIVASFLDQMPNDGGLSMVGGSSGGTSTTNHTVTSISSCSQSSGSNAFSKDATPNSLSKPAISEERGNKGFDV